MEVKKLVADGKTEEAIEVLIGVSSKLQDRDVENQVISLSSQYTALQKGIRSFTITSSNATIRLNRINGVLLAIADDLESTSMPNEVGSAPETDEKSGTLTKEAVAKLEQQQILERLQKLLKRRKFFQDQFDISSDASQKFNLQENIDLMDKDIGVLKEQLGT